MQESNFKVKLCHTFLNDDILLRNLQKPAYNFRFWDIPKVPGMKLEG